MTQPELKMTFDPNTIQHLGVKMYSNIPTAIAELIANNCGRLVTLISTGSS